MKKNELVTLKPDLQPQAQDQSSQTPGLVGSMNRANCSNVSSAPEEAVTTLHLADKTDHPEVTRRNGAPHRTVRADGQLHQIALSRIRALIEYVGEERNDVPTVHVRSSVGPIDVVYTGSGRSLRFTLLPECLRIANKRNHIDRLMAPSLYEVIIFMTALEAIRQKQLQPSIRFASHARLQSPVELA